MAPVTARGEALGLLELFLDAAPDDPTLDYVRAASHALSYVVIAGQRHTDLFERGQRNEPFSLPAEIQRRLLPSSFTREAKQFALAGWLEPASEVAGDTFDYVVDRETLHVSITDAVGHGLAAALLATLTVGSLRNSRRQRLDPTGQGMEANRAVSGHASAKQFVTGLLLRVELATGAVTAVTQATRSRCCNRAVGSSRSPSRSILPSAGCPARHSAASSSRWRPETDSSSSPTA